MAEDGYFWRVVRGETEPSPVMKHIGWKFRAYDAETETLTIAFEARPEFTSTLGLVHGGLQAAMLDETIGHATVAPLGPNELAATIEMKVSFIAPARLGDFVATAHIVKRGRSICFAEARLLQDGELIATASATMKLIRHGA